MDQKIENAQKNILTCFLAQMDSAMKISQIIKQHSEDKILDGDKVISGLVYRLMTPMSNDDMMQSLNNAKDIMNNSDCEESHSSDESYSSDEYSDDDSDDDYNFEEESKLYDIELKDKQWTKIKRNSCNCETCSRVRECLDKYHSYETYDHLANKFRNAINSTCNTHKIII